MTLFINPENFSQTEPARINVTQTKGGIFVDQFGPGIKTITISGVTGYKRRRVSSAPTSNPSPYQIPAESQDQPGQSHFISLRKNHCFSSRLL